MYLSAAAWLSTGAERVNFRIREDPRFRTGTVAGINSLRTPPAFNCATNKYTQLSYRSENICPIHGPFVYQYGPFAYAPRSQIKRHITSRT